MKNLAINGLLGAKKCSNELSMKYLVGLKYVYMVIRGSKGVLSGLKWSKRRSKGV